MELITTINDYKAYRNKNGFIELYKTAGPVDNEKQSSGKSMDKIVTTCTTVAEVEKLLRKKVKLKPKPPQSNDLFS